MVLIFCFCFIISDVYRNITIHVLFDHIYRFESDDKIMDVFIWIHADQCVDKFLIGVEKVRLRDETGYASVASANIQHTIAQTTRRITKTVVLRSQSLVVEYVLGQMEFVCFQVVEAAIFRVHEFIRPNTKKNRMHQ